MKTSVRIVLTIMWLANSVGAQLYLRSDGDPVPIIAASSTEPVVITAPGHRFSSGDLINIEFVLGNTAANGIRVVKNPTRDTFEITDLAGKNIRGNGTFDGSARPIAGKVRAIRLRPNPRFDFSAPAALAHIKDPDGPGPATAPAVRYGYPCSSADRSGCTTWDALVAALKGRTTPTCDGETIALCSNEDAAIRAEDSRIAFRTLLAALGWFADNTKLEYLNAAKYWLNNLHRLWAGRFTACDITAQHCGRGEEADSASETIATFSLAYALVRDQLNDRQRASFRAKIFNDTATPCENMLAYQLGSANLVAGSTTVTGAGFSAYKPNDTIYFKTQKTISSTGMWATVKSVLSDSQMILASPSSLTAQATDHFRVQPWTQRSCGVNWFVSHHGYAPWPAAKHGPAELAAPVDASQSVLLVKSISNWLDPPPFYAQVGKEWVLVQAISGSGPYQISVQRGVLYTKPEAHPAGRTMTWRRYVLGGTAMPAYRGDYTHNLVLQKLYGYIVPAAVLLEDGGSPELLQQAWNYWYDLVYQTNLKQWTGLTGGASNTGYALGRWAYFTYALAHAAAFTFEPSISIAQGTWLRDLAYHLLHLQLPYKPSHTLRFQGSAGAGEQEIEADDVKFAALIQDLYPNSLEAGFLKYWVERLSRSSTHGNRGFLDYAVLVSNWGLETLPYYLVFFRDGQRSIDHRLVLPPWHFFARTTATIDAMPFYAVVSRSTWNRSDATFVFSSGPSHPNDHWAVYTGPGNYKIAKNARLLDDNAKGGAGEAAATNYVEIGNGTNLNVGAAVRTRLDRWRGEADFVYWRFDTAGAYRQSVGVLGAYRHIVHLKGPVDAVVAYDWVRTLELQGRKLRLHYSVEGEVDRAVFVRSGSVAVFEKPGAAVWSQVVLPGEAGRVTHTGPSQYAYTVTVDGGNTTEGEFLIVHLVVPSGVRTFAQCQLIPQIMGQFAGVEIPFGGKRWVLLFAKGGSQDSVAFTSSPYFGIAEVLVVGLTPGLYTVSRDGRRLIEQAKVADDGTLRLSSVAGNLALYRIGM